MQSRALFGAILLSLHIISASAYSQEADLVLPSVTEGKPEAGKRVNVTAPEYVGTQVHHSLYLPADWRTDWQANEARDSKRWPVIVEYSGNFYEAAGSTGRVEDAGLGYGLSGGKFIWVVLPFISLDHKQNERTWWGDEAATVDYAITNVPRICEQFGGDRQRILLCGFSRGAIAASYIGLYNDQIASLWRGLVTHDHFDGVREWKGTAWGTPLEQYRTAAQARLKRLGDRPLLACQYDVPRAKELEQYLAARLPAEQYRVLNVDMTRIFPSFPNELAKHPHNDRWLLRDSADRELVWSWIDDYGTSGVDTNEKAETRCYPGAVH